MLFRSRQLLDHAAENGYGVPAFNVNNLEQVQAIMAAASEVGAPVIILRKPRPPQEAPPSSGSPALQALPAEGVLPLPLGRWFFWKLLSGT